MPTLLVITITISFLFIMLWFVSWTSMYLEIWVQLNTTFLRLLGAKGLCSLSPLKKIEV